MSSLPIHHLYSHPFSLPGQRSVSVLSARVASDAAQVLKKLAMETGCGIDREAHLDLATNHFLAQEDMRNQYALKLDEAALQLWGRKFAITDYKISCIGEEKFSMDHKSQLRTLNNLKNSHEAVGWAHAWAAGLRRPGVLNIKKTATQVISSDLYTSTSLRMQMTFKRMSAILALESKSGNQFGSDDEGGENSSAYSLIRNASQDPGLRKALSWAETSPYLRRVALVERYMESDKELDRPLWACLEADDGDAVVGLLVARALANPDTPKYVNLWKILDRESCEAMPLKKPAHLDYEGWSMLLNRHGSAQAQSRLENDVNKFMRERGG